MEKKLTLDTVVEYVLILAISAVISLLGNIINTITDKNPDTFVSVLDGMAGMFLLFGIALAGSILNLIFPKIPAIIYITALGILLAMPHSPTGAFVSGQVGKIGMLPTVTPILVYAGVSMGKDWIEFKKIGWKGIVVAIFVMIGTYVGSALIAQLILSAQGII